MEPAWTLSLQKPLRFRICGRKGEPRRRAVHPNPDPGEIPALSAEQDPDVIGGQFPQSLQAVAAFQD